MANRHDDFNEMLAKEFEDPAFGQDFIKELVNEEGYEISEALRKTITSMGLKAFSEKAEVSLQRVSDFVAGRRNFNVETIDGYLQKVFGLRLKVSLEEVA